MAAQRAYYLNIKFWREGLLVGTEGLMEDTWYPRYMLMSMSLPTLLGIAELKDSIEVAGRGCKEAVGAVLLSQMREKYPDELNGWDRFSIGYVDMWISIDRPQRVRGAREIHVCDARAWDDQHA